MLLGLVLLAAVGCEAPAAGSDASTPGGDAPAALPVSDAVRGARLADPASGTRAYPLPDVADGPVHPLPAAAPARFAFGTPADPERIARWDIDVRPDGEGLPPGSGDVSRGARVWAETCVACHGATGTEGPFNVLVGGSWPEGGFPEGRTVGSYWPWATTLFDYIRRAMPQDRPGSLDADDTYAVIAWILHRNGIIEETDVMDRETLPHVVMPARDRFVRDDRMGGSEVR
jgi:cytochrome c